MRKSDNNLSKRKKRSPWFWLGVSLIGFMFTIFLHWQIQNLLDAQRFSLAQKITVQILDRESLGSGILIHHQGAVYTILSNHHVLQSDTSSYQVQTSDQVLHPAQGLSTPQLQAYDLGLLQFCSSHQYPLAKISDSTAISVGDRVYASGFPIQYNTPISAFQYLSGQIAWILDQPLQGGYEIGLTNEIKKGMSGGSLLNHQGQLIGINGLHAYPISEDFYFYQNQTQPSQQDRQQMSQYSWAIPIKAFTNSMPKTLLDTAAKRLQSSCKN